MMQFDDIEEMRQAMRNCLQGRELCKACFLAEEIYSLTGENLDRTNLGILLVTQKEHEKGLALLRESFQKQPEDWRSSYHIAMVLAFGDGLEFQDEREALQYALRSAHVSGWKHWAAIAGVAAVYAANGKWEKAEKAFGLSIGLAPESVKARLQANIDRVERKTDLSEFIELDEIILGIDDTSR